MSNGSLVIALVGDVIGSRRYDPQGELLRRVAAVLADVTPAALQPLALTVGDEFQGLFHDLGGALGAWLDLRTSLGRLDPPVEIRVGLGAGDVEDSGAAPAPAGQSGTAWWRARDALDEVRGLERRSHWPRSLRTRYVSDDGDEAGVNAVLVLADQLLAGMDAADLTILDGLRRGRRQVDVADDLGITQSAVARREGDRGASAVYRAIEGLRGSGT